MEEGQGDALQASCEQRVLGSLLSYTRSCGIASGLFNFGWTSSHRGDCCLRGGPLPVLGLLLLLSLTHGRKQVCGQPIQPIEV